MSPGIGSSYVFSLKPGDTVTAIGLFGDFHIKPTREELIYIGGRAGMAPLRAHISHLFENEKTARKVGYWYGTRSKQGLFYTDYFEKLAAEHPNFQFHCALSDPLDEDRWTGSPRPDLCRRRSNTARSAPEWLSGSIISRTSRKCGAGPWPGSKPTRDRATF